MPEISVVIIAYNEEKDLGRCLESVKEVADEIIVVDSFSSDRTVEIAVQHGAKVFTNKFDGHIEQKNFALGLASYPHVLSLDADEELSEDLRLKIKEIKANWKFDAYYFNRLSNFYGKWIYHGDWYPDRKLRLWDKRKGSWGGINPHDKVVMIPGSTKCFVNLDIKHYYYSTIEDHLKNLVEFSTIAANEYYKLGRRARMVTAFVHAWWRFFRAYFLRLGFLDGSKGFIIAVQYSYYTFLKYTKLRQHALIEKSNKRQII